MTTVYNYQPVCANPQSAAITNAAGYTMCSSCPSDSVLGPVWHKTVEMNAKIATLQTSGSSKSFDDAERFGR